MKTFWTYITTLFAGIIAGLLIFLKLKDPDSVINDNQRIGKVKLRGEGNTGSLVLQKEQETLTGMQQRRLKRKNERQHRKELRKKPP